MRMNATSSCRESVGKRRSKLLRSTSAASYDPAENAPIASGGEARASHLDIAVRNLQDEPLPTRELFDVDRQGAVGEGYLDVSVVPVDVPGGSPERGDFEERRIGFTSAIKSRPRAIEPH